MLTKDAVLDLVLAIEEHVSAPSENELRYVDRCRAILEREGTLPSSAVVRLYEIRDGLDARAGLFQSDWDAIHDDFS